MRTLWGRAAATASVLAVCGSLLVGTPAQAADPIVLNLLGINDFHGRIDTNTVKFAGTVEQLRAEGGDARTLMVSAGDNVGASLFPSAVEGDIPTLDVLNALELDASAVGNHEFDKGYSDLTDRIAPAADFPILGSNVFKAGGERALEPYEIVAVDGLDVAVVGAVTQETPSLVNPDGVQGLTFADPVDSINDTVADLNALADPPDVIVASVHEGAPDGAQSYEEAIASSGVFKNLAENTSAEVDAIFMGHTHQAYAYDAPVPGQAGETRPLVQTGSYGANIGQIQLTVDPDTGDVQSHTQRNVARTTAADDGLISTYPRVAEVDTIVDTALANAEEVGGQVKGHLTADITRAFTGTTEDRANESTLGGLVADALLAKVERDAGRRRPRDDQPRWHARRPAVRGLRRDERRWCHHLRRGQLGAAVRQQPELGHADRCEPEEGVRAAVAARRRRQRPDAGIPADGCLGERQVHGRSHPSRGRSDHPRDHRRQGDRGRRLVQGGRPVVPRRRRRQLPRVQRGHRRRHRTRRLRGVDRVPAGERPGVAGLQAAHARRPGPASVVRRLERRCRSRCRSSI